MRFKCWYERDPIETIRRGFKLMDSRIGKRLNLNNVRINSWAWLIKLHWKFIDRHTQQLGRWWWYGVGSNMCMHSKGLSFYSSFCHSFVDSHSIILSSSFTMSFCHLISLRASVKVDRTEDFFSLCAFDLF